VYPVAKISEVLLADLPVTHGLPNQAFSPRVDEVNVESGLSVLERIRAMRTCHPVTGLRENGENAVVSRSFSSAGRPVPAANFAQSILLN
jgi:hypothetical protein